MKSLDPRINRLNIEDTQQALIPKTPLDQFETYEVFQQVKEGKPYEHVGIVHAPNKEMAFLFGKEQYSRRGNTCTGMWIVKTKDVRISAYTDGDLNAYDTIEFNESEAPKEQYEIFHLRKRGKHHVHIGAITASNHKNAAWEAKSIYYDNAVACHNIWVIRTADILFSDPEDKDIWNTLSEKKYRDALAYKSMDKINKFKQEQQQAGA